MQKDLPAEDFARWVVENKPHLVEIEEEIQKIGGYGELEAKMWIRGGKVEKIMFYGGRIWLKSKN